MNIEYINPEREKPIALDREEKKTPSKKSPIIDKTPKVEKKIFKSNAMEGEKTVPVEKPKIIKNEIHNSHIVESKPAIVKAPVEVPKQAVKPKPFGKLEPIENPPQLLSKVISKDKIKVFNEDDDSDIERHFAHSRNKVKDPMESSDISNPPTPIKVPVKAVIATDGSVQLSEQAFKDAKSYVQNLYQGSNVTNMYNMRADQPFDYENKKVFVEGI